MRLIAGLAMLLAVSASDPVQHVAVSRPVPPIAEATELVVLTRNSPTIRYQDADGNFAGIEHDLVEMFAREVGLPVRFVEVDAYTSVLPRLRRHHAHMAAAGLSITPERSRQFVFGPSYMEVRQMLVRNETLAVPGTLSSLEAKRIQVVSDSAGAEQLRRLSRHLRKLQWQEIPTANPEDLLIRVSEGKADYAVAASNVVDVARNFYPNLAKGLPFGETEKLAWAFPSDADPRLVRKAGEFFARIRADGTLKQVVDRYFGHVKRLDRSDLDNLYESMRERLPTYKGLFQEAQEVSGIDWRLIAALAFQESKWDPLATSPTGVRGMMMLTSTTADRLKVKDRLDPRQSIVAGARYLRDIRDSLSPRIEEPDRTWMALAAYNQGLGHLEDARVLAQRSNLNPDIWLGVKSVLPMLSRTEVYETLKHGFARGGEAVALTENVRTFYDILVRFEEPHHPEDSPAPGLRRLLTTYNDDASLLPARPRAD